MSRQNKETRAGYYGIKATPLARDARSKIAKIREKINKLQEPWAEADPMIESATNAALSALDDLAKQYQESAEYLNEPMDV